MLNSATFFFPSFSDLYEGTRMARAADLSGIREIIQPLEESGALVRRTNEEVSVCSLYLHTHMYMHTYINTHILEALKNERNILLKLIKLAQKIHKPKKFINKVLETPSLQFSAVSFRSTTLDLQPPICMSSFCTLEPDQLNSHTM